MIILGIILLVVGLLVSIPILWYIGIILLVVGLLLALVAGPFGHPIGGRRHFF